MAFESNKFKKFNYTTRYYVVSTVVRSITVHYFEKHLNLWFVGL